MEMGKTTRAFSHDINKLAPEEVPSKFIVNTSTGVESF